MTREARGAGKSPENLRWLVIWPASNANGWVGPTSTSASPSR